MQYSAFYVGRRPRAFWDWHLHDKNLRFLRGLDGSYYRHVAEVHEPLLSGDSKLQAAAALRIAYSQGLETLMALMCASMQAPDCILGWMLLYKNQELRELVESVTSSSGDPFVHPHYAPPSWSLFAQRVFDGVLCDDELRRSLQEKFGVLWARFAADFLNERQSQEYNSLKHGSRPRLGGFYMSVGPPAGDGVPPDPEKMVPLGGSDFGSTFWVDERIGGDGLHLRPLEVFVNWVPENLVEGLMLLSISLKNLAAFLLARCGVPAEECEISVPDDEDMFGLPWAKNCGVMSGTLNLNVGPADVAAWSKSELTEVIRKRWFSS